MIAPLSAWHETCHGKVITQFGSSLVAVDGADKSASASKLADDKFEPTADKCTIPADQLDKIHSQKPWWPCQNAATMKEAVCRWLCALHCNGDFNRIESCWWSVLLVPGTVTKERGKPGSFLVLYKCAYGFFGRTVLYNSKDPAKPIVFDPVPKEGWVFRCVEDPKAWQCIDVTPVPPGHSVHDPKLQQHTLIAGLTGEIVPLVNHSLSHGCVGVTRPHLLKMLKHVAPDDEDEGPGTVSELMHELIKRVFPKMTDAQCDDMKNKHEPKAHDIFDSSPILKSSGSKFIPEEDFEDPEFRELFEKHRAAAAQQASLSTPAASTAASSSSSAAASSTGGLAPPLPLEQIQFYPIRGLSQPEAKAYCPPNCVLRKDILPQPPLGLPGGLLPQGNHQTVGPVWDHGAGQ